jgi:hypothetical protein
MVALGLLGYPVCRLCTAMTIRTHKVICAFRFVQAFSGSRALVTQRLRKKQFKVLTRPYPVEMTCQTSAFKRMQIHRYIHVCMIVMDWQVIVGRWLKCKTPIVQSVCLRELDGRCRVCVLQVLQHTHMPSDNAHYAITCSSFPFHAELVLHSSRKRF